MRNGKKQLAASCHNSGYFSCFGRLYIRGDWPRVWAAEPPNNAAQAEAKQQLRRVSKLQQTKLRMMAWILRWRA